MLSAIDIIHTLHKENLSIDSIGAVDICTSSIFAGDNSVVARCRICGADGDFLLKCLYTPYATTIQCRHALCVTYLSIHSSLTGEYQKSCCILRKWDDGIPLDVALFYGSYDYRDLSRLFDRMAYERLLRDEAHGDISPENIIVSDDGMQLIDNDGEWCAYNEQGTNIEYGTPGFAHTHRTMSPPSKVVDDYPIALLSTLIAAMGHYAAEAQEGEEPLTKIPTQLLNGIVVPTQESIAIAKQKLLDVGDMPHYSIACAIGGVLQHIPELKDILEYITTHEEEVFSGPLSQPL